MFGALVSIPSHDHPHARARMASTPAFQPFTALGRKAAQAFFGLMGVLGKRAR
jgi:hypothetical protein